jgi:hypothetical protein
MLLTAQTIGALPTSVKAGMAVAYRLPVGLDNFWTAKFWFALDGFWPFTHEIIF